jgi:hypothetical protein
MECMHKRQGTGDQLWEMRSIESLKEADHINFKDTLCILEGI